MLSRKKAIKRKRKEDRHIDSIKETKKDRQKMRKTNSDGYPKLNIVTEILNFEIVRWRQRRRNRKNKRQKEKNNETDRQRH